jgi:hypothetical protein
MELQGHSQAALEQASTMTNNLLETKRNSEMGD